MPIIGTFSAVKDGYAGTIRTLTLNIKVQLVANDRREADGTPDFRIVVGMTEIGAAWRRTRKGSEETYLSVKLDDPALPQPIWGLREPTTHRRASSGAVTGGTMADARLPSRAEGVPPPPARGASSAANGALLPG